jgi:hypothetical protein
MAQGSFGGSGGLRPPEMGFISHRRTNYFQLKPLLSD